MSVYFGAELVTGVAELINDRVDLKGLRSWGSDWDGAWKAWLGELGSYAKRAEVRERLGAYVSGLLGPLERRNSWQLAEQRGDAHPYGFQHLLNRACWDTQGMRDAVSRRVYQALGDEEGVLIVDETGFLKKGRHSAGVKRQYSGTAGRIENCQIGVFLGYASCWGQGLIDRALFLPEEWSVDRARCQAAGIPSEVKHQPKTELARQMLIRALDQGVNARWVTGDAVYGNSFRLRCALEERTQGYVFGVSGNAWVWQGTQQQPVSTLLATVKTASESKWTRLSAGAGCQGPRLYDWQLLAVNPPPVVGWQRGVLVRRSLDAKPHISAFFIFAPEGTALADLALAAGARWAIERCFQESKSQLGLDHYEVRTWHGWYRHITLVMAAYAFLLTLRRQQLKKNLSLSLGGQCLKPFPWLNCDDGSLGLPSPNPQRKDHGPTPGFSGGIGTSASPSSIIGSDANAL